MKLPSGDLRARKIDVFVVSDAYLGMTYEKRGIEIPGPPTVVDDVKKDKS